MKFLKLIIYLCMGALAFIVVWALFTEFFFVPPTNYNSGCFYTPASVEEFLNLSKNYTNFSQNLSW